jgi:hypothetical protein
MAEKKEVKNDMCRCGHERKHHGKSSSINYTEGKCRKCECENFVILYDPDNREIEYDTPILVTKEQCLRIRKRFGQLIAWRRDYDGTYWVKLWAMEYKDELAKELKV